MVSLDFTVNPKKFNQIKKSLGWSARNYSPAAIRLREGKTCRNSIIAARETEKIETTMTPNRQGTAAPPMLEENGSTRDQVKKDEPSSHWFIHGKAYDLANFAQEHPGGAAIILDSCGRDATPLFESYHAFANRTYIMGKLATYEVPIEAQHKVVAVPLYSFDDNGFYKTVVRRVRGHFKKDVTPKISVTSKIKANWIWYIKIMLQLSALTVLSLFTFAPNLLLSLLPTGTFQGYWTLLGLNLICAFLTGVFFIQVGFTIMHDA